MRQRKVKNLDTKYEEYEDILVRDPAAMKGAWAERSGNRPLFVEIGCGKGKFISELAAREPDCFFVAIEGNMSVMLRAMEKVRERGLNNVVFTPEYAEDLSSWFERAEVQGIYLNFSDPLPKNYWYRRRLTYRARLKSYFNVLAEDGVVKFKTDNTDFFEWSLLEIMAADLKVLDITRDLHAEVMSIDDPEKRAQFNIETEYEAKFSGLGEKIKRVVIGRREKEDADKVNTSLAAYNGRNIPEDIEEHVSGIRPDEASAEEILKTLFGEYRPNSFTETFCTPGETESVRLMVSDYSCPCDRILTSEIHDPVYDIIAEDMVRSVECFALTDEEGKFSSADLDYRVRKLLRNQEHLLIILDMKACADNPSAAELLISEACRILNETDLNKKIALLIDMYGVPDDTLSEDSLAAADRMRSNILPVIAGKSPDNRSFIMCLAYNPEAAREYARMCAFTAASGWTLTGKD